MKNKDYKIIKGCLAFFIVSLVISGLTAVPVNSELPFLLDFLPHRSNAFFWIQKVSGAYRKVALEYPFLFYGYDWLAFAHFILAILFIGPWKDPVRNIWVIKFGLIACVLIFPFAFIAGHFRHIPFGWQLIDCSFGLFGIVPLWICYRKITTNYLKNYK
jgi:hypothetical protein